MQKLVESSRRTLVARHVANNCTEGPYSQAWPQLMPSLANAHPQLAHAAEAISTSAQPQWATNRPTTSPVALEGSASEDASGASAYGQQAWLINIDYMGAVTPPTPFIPGPPRIAADQVFNFDHGALSAGLTDQAGFMVWF